MPSEFDVIIAGAGPGGSMLAWRLARAGVKVLVLEKKAWPRYKPCGGGLTRRSLSELPFDIDHLIEDYTHTPMVLVGRRPVFEATFDEPIVGLVMRDRFDDFLVQQALESGAELRTETRLRSVDGLPGELCVATSRGPVYGRIVVGADGVGGRTGRALGLHVNSGAMRAVEAEVYYSNPDTVKRYRGRFHFDFGMIERGCGWVFPKSGHLSIGLGTYSAKLKDLKRRLAFYMDQKGLAAGADVRVLRGHLIPCRPDRRNAPAGRKGLLVGDAAGYADPVTGEGIYFALRGARIAAEVIVEALASGYNRLESYTRRLQTEFADLEYGRRLSVALYRFPIFSHRVLGRYGDRLGRRMVGIAAGRGTYRDMYRRVFSLSWLGTTASGRPGSL